MFTYSGGTPKASYLKLHLYLYMLSHKNPEIINNLMVDDIRYFKYFFMPLRASIKSFRAACRLVHYVDGSFLKIKRKGIMLCLCAIA